MLTISKTKAGTNYVAPLEALTVKTDDQDAVMLRVRDGAGRSYVERTLAAGRGVKFAARGAAGRHVVDVLDADGAVRDTQTFVLRARTELACSKGPYEQLTERLRQLMELNNERAQSVLPIRGRLYKMLITWTRDHVYTLKAMRYYIDDVKSGLEYWLETQTKNGMFWDCIHPNGEWPGRTWFGEALGKGWFKYDDDQKWIVRRVPVLADTEYVITEGVWWAWKASGDDAWMAEQLPKLEKALAYNNSDPLRWSKKWGLVKRSFCMDGWDFANPLFQNGPDHRRIYKGDPQFLFHGDNSGLYASYWRMADMYEHLGDTKRATELREEGEAFRQRANDRLFAGSNYGHMIPETIPEKKLTKIVGDERERMSLSTAYTINRKLPTHKMAVKIIDEYQRRRKLHAKESFAEWWSMDPMYDNKQWPYAGGGGGNAMGEYNNGGISTLVAGELAKAAFDHGREEYGADILRRVWELSERDNGHLHDTYKRLPPVVPEPETKFSFVDLKSVVNRGLRDKATPGVPAWTGEGGNDMRNLPTGRQQFGRVKFDLIDPAKNDGRAVLYLGAGGEADVPSRVTVPVDNLTGKTLFFMQSLAHSAPAHAVVAVYDVQYADGTTTRIHVRNNHEIGLWWGISDDAIPFRAGHIDRSASRVAWRGANAQWANVGLFMNRWVNPHPDKPITAIQMEAMPLGGNRGGVMLAGISVCDTALTFDTQIRSHGLPPVWCQAAVYYALAEGLGGIEDKSRAFAEVSISPRWAATESDTAAVTLHYPASEAYCGYTYKLDRKKRKLTLDVTGSFEVAHVHALLPGKAKAKSVTVDGAAVKFKNGKVEQSGYADFTLEGVPTGAVTIAY